MSVPRALAATSLGLASVLALAGCATTAAAEKPEAIETPKATSVTVEDNNGKHTIDLPLTSVVATDNRTFQTLSDWGIELTAGAIALMGDDVSYKTDSSIIDLGNHREPNLEAVVAAAPQLIINGQRFADYQDDFETLAPEAVVLNLDPREGKPFDEELKRQVTVLGEVFGKQKEAAALVADFEEAIDRAKKAYNSDETVMALITSAGEVGYVAPSAGRTLGPIFDILGLTPALEIPEGSEDHQGDDISVEAIATANPSWILVMDRDAVFAADEPNYVQASEILEKSEALAGVDAVKGGNIVYMPTGTYLNEGIQTYTTFLNDFADALEKAAKKK
ncbi:siderophore ABC transporter substrate-binding protein [Microbacterium keratanolyticum]